MATIVNVDLTSLNLSAGTHTITAIAKASGFEDSPESEAVQYVVSGESTDTTTIAAGTYIATTDTYTESDKKIGTVPISFESNGTSYIGLEVYENGSGILMAYSLTDRNADTVYDTAWEADGYRTIVITNPVTLSAENAEIFNHFFTNEPFEKGRSRDWIITSGNISSVGFKQEYVANASFTSGTGASLAEHNKLTIKGSSVVMGGRITVIDELLYDDVAVISPLGWANESYRTITFGDNQNITYEMYKLIVDKTTKRSGTHTGDAT